MARKPALLLGRILALAVGDPAELVPLTAKAYGRKTYLKEAENGWLRATACRAAGATAHYEGPAADESAG